MCKFTVYKVMNEFNVYDSYEIVMDVHILTLINYLNIVKRKKEKSILMSLFDSLIDIEKFFFSQLMLIIIDHFRLKIYLIKTN